MRTLSSLALPWLASAIAGQALPPLDDFSIGRVVVEGQPYPYRLLEPLPEHRGVPQPLVVFLHGAGERGDDNVQQLRWLPQVLAAEERRRSTPCYLLAVQCPLGETWVEGGFRGEVSPAMRPLPSPAMRAVLSAMRQVLELPSIDPARVYVTGLSMGGFGAFELAARRPDQFAALLAVCGGGDPATSTRLFGLPVQVFHGAADPVVSVGRSRSMVQALRQSGAPVVYHELENVGHDVWRQAYGNEGALDWLFQQDQRQQRRGQHALPALIPAPDAVFLTGGQFAIATGARCIANADAQPAARLLLDHWLGPVTSRPGLVVTAEPRAGDFVFAIEAGLPHAFELDIGVALTVKARDAVALQAAAAAVHQLLRTWDGGCPTGRVVRRELPPPVRLAFGETTGTWTPALFDALLADAWVFGVRELTFADGSRPPGLEATARERIEDAAERVGIQIVADVRPPAEGSVVVPAGTVPELLALPRRGGPVPFVLQLPPVEPRAVMATLVWQLPAAVEAMQRADGVLHVAGFWSRLGALRR